MENCVAPDLDEFDVIIRSCIVFSQSIKTNISPIEMVLLPGAALSYSVKRLF